MISPARLSILVLSVALSGCYAKVHSIESTSGGSAVTTTASQVRGSAKFSGGQASVSSGQRVTPGAGGGQVSFGKTGTGVVMVSLFFVDFLNYVIGTPAPRPLHPDERIMETCSCFQKPGIGNRE